MKKSVSWHPAPCRALRMQRYKKVTEFTNISVTFYIIISQTHAARAVRAFCGRCAGAVRARARGAQPQVRQTCARKGARPAGAQARGMRPARGAPGAAVCGCWRSEGRMFPTRPARGCRPAKRGCRPAGAVMGAGRGIASRVEGRGRAHGGRVPHQGQQKRPHGAPHGAITGAVDCNSTAVLLYGRALQWSRARGLQV